jgi:hypothetical protein
MYDHVFLSSLPPLPEGGELPQISASEDDILEATARQDRDETEEVMEKTDSTSVSPPCSTET